MKRSASSSAAPHRIDDPFVDRVLEDVWIRRVTGKNDAVRARAEGSVIDLYSMSKENLDNVFAALQSEKVRVRVHQIESPTTDDMESWEQGDETGIVRALRSSERKGE
jgi:hypothetical protein